jgi:16S rRNA (cytidine1402-2'-O)-methyltransferase
MLYIVATPIGNLSDFTFRAIEVLKEVDFILCEDTRVSSKLLNHYEINKKLISFNAVSEEHKIAMVIKELEDGKEIALISDAGTPLLSDPGTKLVNEVLKQGLPVASVPGASALTAAISISGIPMSSFIFEGFIPQKKGRQKLLHSFVDEKRAIVFYESMYRIRKLLEELEQVMPDRLIIICREITKKFEEVLRGKPYELKQHFTEHEPKGEFVVIIAPLKFTL